MRRVSASICKTSLSTPLHLSQSMRAIAKGSRQAVCRCLSLTVPTPAEVTVSAESPSQHSVMFWKSLFRPAGPRHFLTAQLSVTLVYEREQRRQVCVKGRVSSDFPTDFAQVCEVEKLHIVLHKFWYFYKWLFLGRQSHFFDIYLFCSKVRFLCFSLLQHAGCFSERPLIMRG